MQGMAGLCWRCRIRNGGMKKRTRQLWATGLLMAAVFSLSFLAGGMVWKKQGAYQEKERQEASPGAALGEKGQEGRQEEPSPKAGGRLEIEGETDGDKSQGQQEPGQGPKKEATLLFAGDVYFSDYVLNAYEQAGGIEGVLDEGIRREIQEADIFMANQEFPFTERGTKAKDKQFTFRLPPERVSILQEMGIDIVSLANNHILDFGVEGLLDSCQALDRAGILYVGGGEDLEQARALKTIEVGNQVIGFLGTSRVYMDASWAAGPSHPGVFSTYDSAQAIESIRKARKLCDFLVVYVHWGVERETEPKEYQKTMGRQYIDAGADLVVGSHPHVLQDLEYYNGKPIVYSLGNFVFGSSIPQTALLKVVVKPRDASQGEESAAGGEVEASLIPCTSSNGYTKLSE